MNRPVILAVLGAVAAVGAWLAARQGVTVHEFPPFLPGATSTPIAQYSAPWISAAAGAALVAAVLFVLAGFGFRRALVRRRAGSQPGRPRTPAVEHRRRARRRVAPTPPADDPAVPGTPGRMAG